MVSRGNHFSGLNYDHVSGDKFTSASSDDYNPMVECGSSNGFCGAQSMMGANCMPGFSRLNCQHRCFSGDGCGGPPCCCEQNCCCCHCLPNDCNDNDCGGGSSCCSMACNDNCSKVYKQVVHVGPPEPCHVMKRYRLPTPPPDRLDRTICVHPPQRIVHNVFQQPMKPPMVVRTNHMMGSSPPDEIHNHCEMVQPRCRQKQCCCSQSACFCSQSACCRGRSGHGFTSNICGSNGACCPGSQCCCCCSPQANCCPAPFGCIPTC